MPKDPQAKRPFDAALDYLSRCARSYKEVKDKLYSKGYHRAEVDETMDKLEEYRLVNDEQYVGQFLDFYGGKYGRMKLSFKLTTEKGVDKDLVSRIIDERISDEYELEKARACAVKYTAKKNSSGKNELQKAGAFLYSRGFEWDIITKAVAELKETASEDGFNGEE